MIDVLYKCDAYKLGHRDLYNDDIVKMFSMFYARNNKNSNIADNNTISIAGIDNLLYELKKEWNEFFKLNKEEIDHTLNEYASFCCELLSLDKYNTTHLKNLWILGYLPLEIKALQCDSVPYQIPILTISNTKDGFAWLVNYIESYISNKLWITMTSATTARTFFETFTKIFDETGVSKGIIPYLGHDFSLRGMEGDEGAILSGLGHLKYFKGTDNLPSLRRKKLLQPKFKGSSVIATEHSVTTSYGRNGELALLKKMLDNYTGTLSFVADSYDYYDFISNKLKKVKENILAYNGTVVIRPDSGDPIKIICGDKNAPTNSVEYKGTYEILWEIFGGTTNNKGYKVLNKHIGIICGDSVTIQIQREMLLTLKGQGFAPIIAFGIGSTTYQRVNRDTHSFAFKATAYIGEDGNIVPMMKSPKTDQSKKSLSGLLYVYTENNEIKLNQNVTLTEYNSNENLLKTVFLNGKCSYDK